MNNSGARIIKAVYCGLVTIIFLLFIYAVVENHTSPPDFFGRRLGYIITIFLGLFSFTFLTFVKTFALGLTKSLDIKAKIAASLGLLFFLILFLLVFGYMLAQIIPGVGNFLNSIL